MVALGEFALKIFERRKVTRATPVLLLEPLRRPAQHGREAPMETEAGDNLRGAGIGPVVPTGIVRDRVNQILGIEKIVWRVLRRARDRSGSKHHLGKAHGPFPDLLCPHRSADHERETLDSKELAHQPLLRTHVVADPHLGKVWARVCAVDIVGRRRESVADLVDDDDEVAIRIEDALGTDVDALHHLVRARVPGGYQDRVIARLVERANRGVGKFEVGQDAALVKRKITKRVQLVRSVDLGCVKRVLDRHHVLLHSLLRLLYHAYGCRLATSDTISRADQGTAGSPRRPGGTSGHHRAAC